MESNRGRLIPPNLDDQTWLELFNQARALIPQLSPQWTDHNPSDVGITLLELFAFLTEKLQYRINRVSAQNLYAFMHMLGFDALPMRPARTLLTFSPIGGNINVSVAKGAQAHSPPPNTPVPVTFETEETVLAVDGSITHVAWVTKQNANTFPLHDATAELVPPPGAGATLAISDVFVRDAVLCIGFVMQQSLNNLDVGIYFQFSRPFHSVDGVSPDVNITWSYSRANEAPFTFTALNPSTQVVDGTQGFRHDGLVRLKPGNDWVTRVPANWADYPKEQDQSAINDARHWIGVKISQVGGATATLGIKGIFLNTVEATTALTLSTADVLVNSAPLELFLEYQLANRPLYADPRTPDPYAHLQVTQGATVWTRVDRLRPTTDKEYLLEAETSTIRFGNYQVNTTGHAGQIPTYQQTISALYRYVNQGSIGNLGAGQVTAVDDAVLATKVAVNNAIPSTGGADLETPAEVRRRAPAFIEVSDRAIAPADYERLALQASPLVHHARCLGPRTVTAATGPWSVGNSWFFAGMDRGPGSINLIVVPTADYPAGRPKPSRALITQVRAMVDPRQQMTDRLYVQGPKYLPVQVVASGTLWRKAQPAMSTTTLQSQTVDKITRFLHPVTGGKEGRGWQVGESLLLADLYRAVAPDPQVGFISSMELTQQVPDYASSAWNATNERPFAFELPGAPFIRLTDYELLCAGTVSVSFTPEP